MFLAKAPASEQVPALEVPPLSTEEQSGAQTFVIPAPPFPSCVTLAKALHLSVLQLLFYKMGLITGPSSRGCLVLTEKAQ